MKHTPGPWHFGDETSLHGTKLVYAEDGWLVADAGRIMKRSGEEIEANARLISSAPDLLEALDELLHTTLDLDISSGVTLTDEEERIRKKAVEAIAKATGSQ